MDELRHECGIAAVYYFDPKQKSSVWTGDPEQVHRLIPRMLLDLQNRGQLSAGFTSYNPERDQLLDTYKEIGTVSEAFRMSQANKFESILDEHSGAAAIGHVRYATCGPTGAATPSRSSAATAAGGSGSGSRSTATSPTSRNCGPSCSRSASTT